jgi:hypothetical protein
MYLAAILLGGLLLTAVAREWTNTKGQTMDAELVGLDGEGTVILRRSRDGKEMRVPLSKLSPADQAYVVEQQFDDISDDGSGDVLGELPESTPIILVVLALVNIPIYLILGKGFFGDLHGFLEALRFVLTPDWFSMFQGEWLNDQWQSIKFVVFVVMCIGAVAGEFWLLWRFVL